MAAVLREPLRGAQVWTGAEMRGRTDWMHHLTPAEIAELDAALAAATGFGGDRLFTMTRDDFPLGSLADRLAALRVTIDEGCGFHLLRGVPVGRYTEEQHRRLAWGIAVHLGDPEPQDGQGSLMHDIRDTGQRVETTDNIRGFQTNTELHFHNDGGDAFLLLCLRTARQGGTSKLASVAALFNAVLARRPDLAAVLQQPFHFDARAQQGSGRPR
ncbi:MAG: TauD/TfdA family dioxygenase, partial [Acetobacteraceae bacterium]|nr:TauD/TfdA family dioxygenase [Acetobacteraceae bacterium]